MKNNDERYNACVSMAKLVGDTVKVTAKAKKADLLKEGRRLINKNRKDLGSAPFMYDKSIADFVPDPSYKKSTPKPKPKPKPAPKPAPKKPDPSTKRGLPWYQWMFMCIGTALVVLLLLLGYSYFTSSAVPAASQEADAPVVPEIPAAPEAPAVSELPAYNGSSVVHSAGNNMLLSAPDWTESNGFNLTVNGKSGTDVAKMRRRMNEANARMLEELERLDRTKVNVD
ncbi:MAG: hypothetical protein QF755_04220 [Candidatus Peribacteraceae bacterium]|nr:hypothetical protein [Candidatus Peribacteraceae bacterium]